MPPLYSYSAVQWNFSKWFKVFPNLTCSLCGCVQCTAWPCFDGWMSVAAIWGCGQGAWWVQRATCLLVTCTSWCVTFGRRGLTVHVLGLINVLLQKWIVPVTLKEAALNWVLRNTFLDGDDFKNYLLMPNTSLGSCPILILCSTLAFDTKMTMVALMNDLCKETTILLHF